MILRHILGAGNGYWSSPEKVGAQKKCGRLVATRSVIYIEAIEEFRCNGW